VGDLLPGVHAPGSGSRSTSSRGKASGRRTCGCAAPWSQTHADVGSFDGGFGSAYLARMVGQEVAREIFFLGRTDDADWYF